MRICTITCNNADNYGARLQAYALQHYLQLLGHDVKVIDYAPDYMTFDTRLWYSPGLSVKELVKLVVRYRQRRTAISKHAALERFSAERLVLTRRYRSAEDLRYDPPEADVYICGSDQIWNTCFANGRDAAYYLDFGPGSVRRVSYAASFAVPEIAEDYHRMVAGYLSRLDDITVRESSAVDIVRSLGHEATVVCDPVLLLDAEFWGGEVADGCGAGEEYLLVYDFERSDSIRRVAQRIAALRGLSIYSVSPWRLPYARRNFCDCRPESFVSLFANASCVVSNSLHGSIFSLVFAKDFYVVNRNDGLNVRMRDLMSMVGLEGFVITPSCADDILTAHIPYATAMPRLLPMIQRSRTFLASL